jgi:hypothetical protein
MKLCLKICLALLIAGCSSPYIDLHVSYQKQPIKIAKCKPVVQYQATSFKTSGVEIPIPQLGGSTKVGEVSLSPQTLNTLYREVAILDALRLQYCDARLAAAQVSLASLEAANNRMLEQQEKIAMLALSTTHGEESAQKALNTITKGPAPAPDDPATAKLDTKTVAQLKQKAEHAAPSGSPPARTAAGAPASSAVAPPLPPQVAEVVKSVSSTKLLRAARSESPKN